MSWKKFKPWLWQEMVFLLLISSLVYLPRLWELTYNKDDWYFMYDGLVLGAGVFRDIALHTRPIRGILYEFLYTLFGPLPLPYHLTSYLWRLLGGWSALWLFNMLWPRERQLNFSLATLFLLFPGFYWWVSGFELQPNVISVGLEAFSIALTLKAIEADSPSKRVYYTLASFLSGWAYLSLVEYAIGMEGFRLLCVYLWVARKHNGLNFTQSVWKTIRTYGIFLIIPIGFVIWYEFFFENWRKAQDTGTQLSALFNSPLNLLWWWVKLIQSTLNVSILSWFVPFHENFISGRLYDVLLGLAFTLAAVIALLAGDSLISKDLRTEEKNDDTGRSLPQFEVLWLGLLGTLAGVIPIVVANRSVVFERVSQYTLPASLAGSLLMGGIVYSVVPRKFRTTALSVLVALAALSHHGLAAKAVAEQDAISDFWWQVTWRAPRILDDTLLVVRYPNVQYMDNDEMVWGPANFIYNREPQEAGPVKVLISAARMEQEAITNIVMGSKDFDKVDLVIKYTSIHYNYKNILVVTQPAEQSCVHLIDWRWPDISAYDEPLVSISALKSDTANVVIDEVVPLPQKYVFGTEPLHSWCFYYQKADLARQQGNWEEIAALAKQAARQELHPNDQIEWMPFLQAYAFLGDEKEVKQISTRINTEAYNKQQACQNLNDMGKHGYPLSAKMRDYIAELFCKAGN